MFRRSLLITVGVAVTLGLIFLYGPWSSDRLVFSPATKVCQLTGVFDKQHNKLTYNHARQFGVTGSDLGYPVPWQDKLLFLFGDTRTIPPDEVLAAAQQKEELTKGYDSVAEGPLYADIERSACVRLEFLHNEQEPKKFRPLQLREIPEPPGPRQDLRTLGVFETLSPASPEGTNCLSSSRFAVHAKILSARGKTDAP